MNIKSWLLIAVAVVLAAGCAAPPAKESPRTMQSKETMPTFDLNPNGFNPADFTLPDRTRALVWVDSDNEVIVDQEPVRRAATTSQVTIIWYLERGYSFPVDDAQGKAIDMQFVSGTAPTTPPYCARSTPNIFFCTYTPAGPATFKYSIRVRLNPSGPELTKVDPTVVQR
jgi:hypothetical protein